MKRLIYILIGAIVIALAGSTVVNAQTEAGVKKAMTIKEGEALTDSLFKSNCYIDIVMPDGMSPAKYSITEDFNTPSEFSAAVRVAMLRFLLREKLERGWKLTTDATAEELKISEEMFNALMADMEANNAAWIRNYAIRKELRDQMLEGRQDIVGDNANQHYIKYFTYYHRPFTL